MIIDRKLCRTGMALLALCAALPAVADTQFRVRRMTRDDVPPGKGQCDIRLQVDNEVEVRVRGDMVFIRTLAGQDARDDGSECNAPLPDRDLRGFRFEVIDSRNEIRLVSEPLPRDGFAAIVQIRDSSGGFGRYHFRLSWEMSGGYSQPPNARPLDGNDRPFDRKGQPFDRPGGLVWNNAIHYGGPGRGESVLAGYGAQRLSDLNMDIDRGGRILVSFRTNSGRPLTFAGEVMDRQGETMRANVATDDHRLRGTMYISIDGRQQVYRVALEATDGRDRLRLNWDRR
jgi:hypothetical protein